MRMRVFRDDWVGVCVRETDRFKWPSDVEGRFSRYRRISEVRRRGNDFCGAFNVDVNHFCVIVGLTYISNFLSRSQSPSVRNIVFFDFNKKNIYF